MYVGLCTKCVLKHRPKPKTVTELKVKPEKIWDNFLQVQLTKMSRVFDRKRLSEYVKSSEGHFENVL